MEALLRLNADPCLPNYSGNTCLVRLALLCTNTYAHATLTHVTMTAFSSQHFAYETENLPIINAILIHGELGWCRADVGIHVWVVLM